jgi:Ni/Co efflux regulator RcnB
MPKDGKHPGRRVERDVRGKLQGHREEPDAHHGGAGEPSHQKEGKLFEACTITTRAKENKLPGHHEVHGGHCAGVNPTQKKKKYPTSNRHARGSYYPQDWRWTITKKWIHYTES